MVSKDINIVLYNMDVGWVPKKALNKARINELLEASIITNHFTNGGPNTKKLEERLRDCLEIDDSKAIVCVANGTVALWATIAALEVYLNKSLQFCTQSFTFPASAQGYLENVKIVDIDNEGGIDIEQINPEDCDGIIVTNVFGNIVNIQKYEDWSKKHNKFLVFDNAATSYTSYKGKNACNYGHATTLSFHHTKPIGFGEGGCIIIDKEYERTLRNVLNFGIDNMAIAPKWHRKGGNYKMSDIQAVYILQYLDKFNHIKNYTQELYGYFLEQVKNKFELFPNFSDDTPFVSCICIFSEKSNEVISLLLENKIYCRKYYNPLMDTSVATEFFNKIVCISCTIDMNKKDIDRIIEIIMSINI
jgi:dTDP-4-amino-4,6-dideoxygalactose transaminase